MCVCMRTHAHTRSAAGLFDFAPVLALLPGACGISTDNSPRDIPAADQRELGVTGDRTAGAATGTARVYLLAPEVAGQAQTLVAVARDVEETPTDRITALFAGRLNVAFADVAAVAPAALRHRLLLNFEGQAEGVTTDAVIKELLEKVPAESK